MCLPVVPVACLTVCVIKVRKKLLFCSSNSVFLPFCYRIFFFSPFVFLFVLFHLFILTLFRLVITYTEVHLGSHLLEVIWGYINYRPYGVIFIRGHLGSYLPGFTNHQFDHVISNDVTEIVFTKYDK